MAFIEELTSTVARTATDTATSVPVCIDRPICDCLEVVGFPVENALSLILLLILFFILGRLSKRVVR